MENRKIRVLHIVKDEKFFDGVIKAFESDERFMNRSILVVQSQNYKFSHIKQKEKVELLWTKKMLKECLQSSDYDVVYFHSLTTDRYKFFKFIPEDKVVIWWSWGFDIYSGSNGIKPLIQIDQFKPKTLQLIAERKKKIAYLMKDWIYYIKGLLKKNSYYRLRKQVLSRIDFFQPVIPQEYQMMQSIEGFRAKEFYYPRCFMSYQVDCNIIPGENGNVLIGNSATYTNNHLDIWYSIRNYIPKGRDILIPANYGIKRYAKRLASEIKSKDHNIRIFHDFMPQDEYFQMIKGCSYAVFGVIRQQAMGNINYCLCRGIKVFLYRESLVYQFLKSSGYVVFAIEDVDEDSFRRPLTIDQMQQNSNAFEKEKDTINKVRESAIDEIIKRCMITC